MYVLQVPSSFSPLRDWIDGDDNAAAAVASLPLLAAPADVDGGADARLEEWGLGEEEEGVVNAHASNWAKSPIMHMARVSTKSDQILYFATPLPATLPTVKDAR